MDTLVPENVYPGFWEITWQDDMPDDFGEENTGLELFSLNGTCAWFKYRDGDWGKMKGARSFQKSTWDTNRSGQISFDFSQTFGVEVEVNFELIYKDEAFYMVVSDSTNPAMIPNGVYSRLEGRPES
jgi:hypothetical protein